MAGMRQGRTSKRARAAFAAVLLAAALVPAGARGELAWSISGPTIGLGDFDEEHAGQEGLFAFTIQNLSSAGDANNLISFTLTAPADMQIWDVSGLSAGWSYINNGDTITFNGNGNYIPPGNQLPLNLYSYHLTTAQGTADATAAGTIEGTIPFNQLNAIPLPGVEAGWTGRVEMGTMELGLPSMTIAVSPSTVTAIVQRGEGELTDGDWQTVTNLVPGTTQWTDTAATGAWERLYYRLAR